MTTTDVEMEEMIRNDENNNTIDMIRKKLLEWGSCPYMFQIFNKDESAKLMRLPKYHTSNNDITESDLSFFNHQCQKYESFDFFIEPMIVGDKVNKQYCSYSELQNITDFKTKSVIQKMISGTLLHGTINEGFQTRPAIVKTWDLLYGSRADSAPYLKNFCDEIELFTDERVNTHPNLVKMYKYCFEKRLAIVFDKKFTKLLSDVLLEDDFGWDKRMKVATQLADLLAWLHEKRIAGGILSAKCIMIDEEVNIKVFEFEYVSHHVNADLKFFVKAIVGFEAPRILEGEAIMKCDTYMFGLLLINLMAKKEFGYENGPNHMERSIVKEAIVGKKYLVHECFKEVDYLTAFDITFLAFRCLDIDRDKRPAMKDVLDALKAMELRGKKRKRDENEAEV